MGPKRIRPGVSAPGLATRNTLDSPNEHLHSTTVFQTADFGATAFFGGSVSRFIRFGDDRQDTSKLVRAINAQGGFVSPETDLCWLTGSCWSCWKSWPDMFEGWLTWTPEHGPTLQYGVCYPCYRDWVGTDAIGRLEIEQRAEIRILQHYLGAEVAV